MNVVTLAGKRLVTLSNVFIVMAVMCACLQIVLAKHPLGPFTYASGNPVLRKTTGVVTGPGHGCVVKGPDGHFWQFYTLVLTNPPGGRRIGMDPVGFDEKGNLFVRGPSETPQWAPGVVDDPIRRGDSGSIPLTVNKVRVMRSQSSFSSQRPGREAAYAVDNANGTWWEPAEDDKQPTLSVGTRAETSDLASCPRSWHLIPS